MEVKMNQAVSIDLIDLQDAIEHLAKNITAMSMRTKVDVAARLRAVVKTANIIDELIKADIREQCHQADGTVNGEIFKARLAYHQVTRLDSKALKEERPKIYEQFCVTTDEGRITFEAR